MKNESKIKQLVKKYKECEVESIELLNSSQNKVYKVVTNKGTFVVKEFSKDAIKNYYYLRRRKEQLSISKKFNRYGINTAHPIALNSKNFILMKNHYYVMYNFLEEESLSFEELTASHIKVLAETQAAIHKLKIRTNLPCIYKKVRINYNYQIKLARIVDDKLYEMLVENKDSLEKLTEECNCRLKKVKNNLCVSHNDYKLANILWNKKEMTLVDFDATGLANPTSSLCESAFTFSYNGKTINYNFYSEYLRRYINIYGKIEDNFEDCVYACLNGKLQWLSYMFAKNKRVKDNYVEETKEMLKELLTYYKGIKKMQEIYDLLK